MMNSETREDKELVLLAVGENGLALQFAGEGLRGDSEVVERAVQQNGWSL